MRLVPARCECDLLRKVKALRVVVTSSPGNIFLRATTCSTGSGSDGWELEFDARGNTMTALGRHEWLKRAARGDTHVPRGERAGDVSVNVLVVN
jgi:hypothetical protein